MAGWAFHNPVRVHFGAGSRARLADMLAGRAVLAVTTARGRRQMEGDAPLSAALSGAGRVTWHDGVAPNPGLSETQEAIDRLAGQSFDTVLAFGGGSAMDAAKALAAALPETAAERRLDRLIADPRRIGAALPILALPTTSGTGAEVTPFATIWDHAAKQKLSLASPKLFPRMALVDPDLTWGLPRDPTLSTGLDALNQAFESVWNRNRSGVTLGFAGRAIGLAFEALPRLAADLGDRNARAGIAEAALLAGLAISQTRTAICHAMSYPLTAHFGLPHGWACAATMAAAARLVLEGAPAALEEVAPLAGHDSAAALVDRLEHLLDDLGVAHHAAAVLPEPAAARALAPQMCVPGHSDNFVLKTDAARIADILRASLG